jgi:hypothetical protein
LSPERPSSSAGPTRVGVGVFLNDLVGLDDIAQVFTADLFLVLQWTDPRLAEPARGSSLSICSLDGTQVWMPLVQFQDVRRLTKNYQDITGIDARGMVTHAQRLGLDIAVRFDLRDFPFDQHTLELEVRPVLSSVDEVELAVLDNLTGVDERVSLTGWTIGTHTASIETRHAPRLQVDQSLFRLQLEVGRESSFYILKTLVPLGLIIFMSWAVFWIDPHQIGPQIALSATSMLTLIAYQFALIGLLPRISYLTRADRFVLASSILVFLALVEAVTASALVRSGRAEQGLRLDKMSRVAFPVLLVVIIIFSFVV